MSLLIKGVGDTWKFSVSDLVYFEDCRRQWLWGREYTTSRPQLQLWFGNVLHAGLEEYYKNNRSLAKGLIGLNRQLDQTIKEMRQFDEASFLSSIDKYEELAGMFEPLLTNYSIFDSEEPLQGDVFEVEKYFNLPVSPTLSISGKIDLILKTGRGYIIVDHKTSSTMPARLEGLDLDEQMTAYAWAFYQMYGELPIAIIYNTIVKSLPKEPEVLKTLTKDKKPQLSRAMGQSTVYSAYLNKLYEIGADPKEYQEILSYLRARGWSSFFRREESSRNFSAIQNFHSRAIQKMEYMVEACKDFSKAHPSPQTHRCAWCSFLQPCLMNEREEDYEIVLQSSYITWDEVHARRKTK
jgi:hypothetical protein